jgi:hypothetical protein
VKIVYNKNCTVCKLVKRNRQAREDIYNTTYYNPQLKVSLLSVARKYEINDKSLYNHVKKHQFLTEQETKSKIVQAIEDKTEKQLIKELVTHGEVRNLIMTKGLNQIKQGKIKLDAKTVLSAAKDQMNYEMKAQDNQLKMMEMIWHFASGESTESEAYDRAIIEGETATNFDPTHQPVRSD